MSKHSEAGKGSTQRKVDKDAYDRNYERIWGKKNNKLYEDRHYDSEASDDWNDSKIDIIGLNGNTGEHYIK
jgi:hypothetical protein